MTIAPGNVFGFWMLIAISALVIYTIRASERGKFKVTIRPIAGLEAIEECVGRATEMGRPVHFSPGLGDIVTTSAPDTLAALQILSYVTDVAAKYDARFLVTIRMPNVYPLATETVRQGYIAANKADSYRDNMVGTFQATKTRMLQALSASSTRNRSHPASWPASTWEKHCCLLNQPPGLESCRWQSLHRLCRYPSS